MSDPIDIEIEGLKEIERLLNEAGDRYSDLSTLMLALSRDLAAAVRKNFETEGKRLGTPWPGLKKATLDRRKEGQSKAMLRDSDDLWNALATYSDRTIAVIGVGKEIHYAAIHQFGGTIKGRTVEAKAGKWLFWPGATHPVKKVTIPDVTMPARPYLALAPEDIEQIKNTILEWMANGGKF